MKKFKYLLILIILITGCSSKNSITSKEFKNIVRDNDYYVVDSTEQFSDYDYINEALVAVRDEESYQIEFYVLEDEENAVAFYNLNKEVFEANEDSESTNTDTNNKYTLTTSASYKVLSIKDNTVIYVDVDVEYKKDIKNILKRLGY